MHVLGCRIHLVPHLDGASQRRSHPRSSTEIMKVVPFTTFEYISACILVAACLVGLFIVTSKKMCKRQINSFIVILLSMLSDKNRSFHTSASNVFVFSITLNVMLLDIYCVMLTIYNLQNGGFAVNKFWCTNILTSILLILECTTIVTAVALVFDLYLVLIKRVYMTAKQATIALGTICFISIMLISSMYFFDDPSMDTMVAVQPGHLICMVDFTLFQTITKAKVAISLSIAVVMICVFSVFFVYAKVFMLYFQSNRRSSSIPLTSMEKTLLFRSISIFLCLTVFWFPYFSKILIESISAKQVSSEFDCICTVMFAFFDVSVLFLLIFQDANLRYQIYAFIKVTKSYQTRIETRIEQTNTRISLYLPTFQAQPKRNSSLFISSFVESEA